jgi:predicted restriction endonuclease
MVYFGLDESTDPPQVKIGYTKRANPYERFDELRKSDGWKLRLIGLIKGDLKREHEVHSIFRSNRVNREMFLFDELIQKFIREHCSLCAFHKLIFRFYGECEVCGLDRSQPPETVIASNSEVLNEPSE